MNKLNLFLHCITLGLLIVIATQNPGTNVADTHTALTDADSRTATNAINTNAVTTIESAAVMQRLELLEQKLDRVLADSAYPSNPSHDAAQSGNDVLDPAQAIEAVDAENYVAVQSMFSTIKSTGILTGENAEELKAALSRLRDPQAAVQLLQQINVAINNNELRIEPGVIF